ncbi:hypothetical protein B0A49_06846 [Cryomyces minteri]|uniref:ZZ-type domain-containing protein n=1 Tax=Cryomyces minteri TaxID=331657 RepID=A0A4U0X5V5_9PEZI|nr:hypothetical protein B0A49_06846 [Cryomyces minteri]
MDPHSIAASITALLGLANQVVSYVNAVREAGEARRQLRGEMDRLRSVLSRVEDRVTEARKEVNRGEAWDRGLGQVAGLMTLLQTAMEKLRDELRPEEGVKKLVKKLRYSWDKSEFSEMLQNIQRYYVAIGLVVQHDLFDLSVETTRQLRKLGIEITDTQVHVSRIENTGEDTNYRIKQVEANGIETKSDGKEVKANLARLLLEQQDRDEKQRIRDEEQRFRDEKQRERDEKQQKLEEDAERKAVEDWLSPSNHLQKRFDPLQNPVICIFLDVKDPKTQVKDNLFGGLLKQLIQLKGPGPMSEDLLQAYQNWKETGVKLALSALRDLLLDEVALFDRVFLLVDALDECTEGFRNWLEDELEEYRPDNMSIFITSRPFGEQKLGEVGCRTCKKRPLRIYWHCDNCVDDENFDICQGCRDRGVTCGHKDHELTEPYPHIEVEVLTPPEELSEYVKFETRKEIGHEGRRDRRSHPRRRSTRFGARLLNNPKLEEDISTSIVERAEGNFIFAKLYMDALKVQQTTEDIEEALSAFPRSLTTLYEKSMEQRILVQDNEKDKETAMRTLSLLCCAQQTLTLAELQQALATKKGDTKFHWGRDYSKDDILHVTKGLVNIDSSSDPSVRLFHLTFATYLDETREPQPKIAKALLKHQSIDINMQDTEGYTALSLAVAVSCSEIVADLLSRPGIRVDLVENSVGRSALALAAERGSTTITKMLLQHKADPELRDNKSGGTPIFNAVEWGNLNVMETMLAYDVDPFCEDDDGRTLLHAASVKGDVNILHVLKARGLSIDSPDKYGFTPLHDASRKGEFEAAEFLLESGADPVRKDNSGRSPFVVAQQYNQPEIMTLLQEKCTDDERAVMVPVDMEDLPLWSQVNLNRADHVASAIDHQKDKVPVTEPGTGETALHWAVRDDQTEILRMLLDSNLVSVNCANRHNRTPLHLAAACGHLEAAMVLLEHGVEVDHVDQWHATALAIAQSNRKFDTAISLVEANATVDVKGVDIQKLFFAAIELQSATAVEKLLATGADALAKNEEGKTAMDLAKDAGDDDVTHLVAWSKTFYRDEASLAQEQGRKMRPMGLRTGSAHFPMPDDV